MALALQLAWSYLTQEAINRPLIEIPMFALSYLAIATLTSLLGQQLRATAAWPNITAAKPPIWPK